MPKHWAFWRRFCTVPGSIRKRCSTLPAGPALCLFCWRSAAIACSPPTAPRRCSPSPRRNAPRWSIPRLRLPEPVDAVFCLLDSLNYVTEPEDVRRTFRRVLQALRPGGMFLFDINTPQKLRGLDGQVFLDENEDSYCVWRAEFDPDERICYYGIDLFRRQGKLWQRSFEQHCEYAYEPDELTAWLTEAGFVNIRQFGDRRLEAPTPQEQRIYFCAEKKEG